MWKTTQTFLLFHVCAVFHIEQAREVEGEELSIYLRWHIYDQVKGNVQGTRPTWKRRIKI